MSTDGSTYVQPESHLCAAMDTFWPPIQHPPYPLREPPDGEIPFRIRAALTANPGGLTMGMLCWLTDLEWDVVYPLMQRAAAVGRVRAWVGRDFISQGEQVHGSTRFVLVERKL